MDILSKMDCLEPMKALLSKFAEKEVLSELLIMPGAVWFGLKNGLMQSSKRFIISDEDMRKFIDDLYTQTACERKTYVPIFDLKDVRVAGIRLPDGQIQSITIRKIYPWFKHMMGTDEASKLWGLNQDYIKRLCNEGKVQAVLVGKTWIINKAQDNPKKKCVTRKYIKHPALMDEERITIGFCCGLEPRDWSTFYSKEVLQEFQQTNFKDEGDNTLQLFIDKFDELDVSLVRFSNLIEVTVVDGDFDSLRRAILLDNLGFVLPKKEVMVLIIDEQWLYIVEEISKVLGVKIETKEYICR